MGWKSLHKPEGERASEKNLHLSFPEGIMDCCGGVTGNYWETIAWIRSTASAMEHPMKWVIIISTIKHPASFFNFKFSEFIDTNLLRWCAVSEVVHQVQPAVSCPLMTKKWVWQVLVSFYSTAALNLQLRHLHYFKGKESIPISTTVLMGTNRYIYKRMNVPLFMNHY